MRIVEVTGYDPDGTNLEGLSVKYNYDEGQTDKVGNLTSVIRTGSGKVSRSEHYQYTEGNGPEGHNLIVYTDPNQIETHYVYGTDTTLSVSLRGQRAALPDPQLDALFKVAPIEMVQEIVAPGGAAAIVLRLP